MLKGHCFIARIHSEIGKSQFSKKNCFRISFVDRNTDAILEVRFDKTFFVNMGIALRKYFKMHSEAD